MAGNQPLETGKNMTVENVASVDYSRNCVHNNVALCALTFKIVVLAWNRSHLPSIKEAFLDALASLRSHVESNNHRILGI